MVSLALVAHGAGRPSKVGSTLKASRSSRKLASSRGMSSAIFETPWNLAFGVDLVEGDHELHLGVRAVERDGLVPRRVALEADGGVGDGLARRGGTPPGDRGRHPRRHRRVAVSELVVHLGPLIGADVDGVVLERARIEQVGAPERAGRRWSRPFRSSHRWSRPFRSSRQWSRPNRLSCPCRSSRRWSRPFEPPVGVPPELPPGQPPPVPAAPVPDGLPSPAAPVGLPLPAAPV